MLSGLVSSLAAVIYVAHLGQAKADAGTGYELLAITAVVLGGTSIFGGRGSVHGTLLGLFAISVLQNGLRLADLPAELAGVLTGVLLLVAIGLDRRPARAPAASPAPPLADDEVMTVKNAQVAVICAVILGAAVIVAASNVYLVRSLRDDARGRGPAPSTAGSPRPAAPAEGRPIVVAMMPKSKGNAYFIACRKGAEEAARELGVELIWDGPTEPEAAKQNEVIDTWITRGVDVIAVAVENRQGISSVLRKARARGIKVITWDADAEPDARDFFVNQATPEGIGQTLMDNAARVLGGKGQFAIITASLTAANMIEWQKTIEARRKEKYPDIMMAALRPCDDLQKKAFDEATAILNANPDVKLIMAICTPAVPAPPRRSSSPAARTSRSSASACPTTTSGTSTRGSPTASSCGTRWTSATSPSTPRAPSRPAPSSRATPGSRPGGSAPSRSGGTTSSSASRSSSPRRTLISSTSDPPAGTGTSRECVTRDFADCSESREGMGRCVGLRHASMRVLNTPPFTQRSHPVGLRRTTPVRTPAGGTTEWCLP